MEKFLFGKKAFEHWGVPNLDRVFRGREDEGPEYVVFEKDLYRYRNAGLQTCSIVGSEQFVKDGVCTLPYALLREASRLSNEQFLFLAMSICSYNGGNPSVCSWEDLVDCAEKLKGHRGRRKALWLLKYARPEARSPREIDSYMLLSLPHSLGGAGLKGFVLNHKIVDQKSGEVFYADLYYEPKKLIVEYNSRQFHRGKEARIHDLQRKKKLEDLGYTVIFITPRQVTKRKRLKRLLMRIARAYGKRIRVRAAKYFEAAADLRNFMISQGEHRRKRGDFVRLEEVPLLPLVPKYHILYEWKFSLREAYPNGKLTLPPGVSLWWASH